MKLRYESSAENVGLGSIGIGERNTVSFSKRIDQERISTLSKKIAQGNLTASCKRLISWFLLFKATELGRKIFPVRPPKF
ncbi:hypothetical protein TNCV_2159901 [Trichonephila clavipes]|nr:hypothetical protein TNCV_2159901 [Trichonephila clavipes]